MVSDVGWFTASWMKFSASSSSWRVTRKEGRKEGHVISFECHLMCLLMQ